MDVGGEGGGGGGGQSDVAAGKYRPAPAGRKNLPGRHACCRGRTDNEARMPTGKCRTASDNNRKYGGRPAQYGDAEADVHCG